MADFVEYMNQLIQGFLHNLPFFLGFISIFWLVLIVNKLFFKGRLDILGIYPRHPLGLVGIIFSPFLHADFGHLFVNTMMLLVLGFFILSAGIKMFCVVTGIIILLSGLLVWLLGRPALHIGASGLVMGYWGYVLVNAYNQPSLLTIVIAAVCLYYFSGMFVNLFPTEKHVSWEGHVFGFIAGIATVYIAPLILPWFH